MTGLALAAATTTAFADCATDGNHWYARAVSGYPSLGTKIDTHTPASWSVGSSQSTSDNAAWLWNNNNTGIALEGGYFTGFFPYDSGYTNGLQGYETTDNGVSGSRKSTFIPASTLIGMYVISGATVRIDISGAASLIWTFSYGVANGVNFSQGEVTTTSSTWMNGGSGTQQAGFWSPNGSAFYAWGYHNDCKNSPYWITSNDASHWTSGGY